MTLKEIDSSKLLFDIHSKDLVEQFKAKFTGFEDYTGQIDEKKVIQYIILMADVNSPLRISVKDWYQRKYTAATLVKFPMNKKVFSDESEKLIIGEDDAVNASMVAYIASYGRPEYSLLMSFMALMSYETQKALSGEPSKDSDKTIDRISKRVVELTKEFFHSGDTDEYSRVKQSLYARIEKEKLRLRPEQIIRQLEENGELPEDFNPYENSYKISAKEDLIFLGDKAPKKNG